MSYSESDGEVTLKMSREDYDNWLITFAYAAGAMMRLGDKGSHRTCVELLNRLNEGNPNYTPYRTGEAE